MKFRFLALGDSYTIGESVEPNQRWPMHLVHALADAQFECESPIIIAKTGWTTDELDKAIDDSQPEGDFHLVSLLIGVNNQYRQRSVETYKPEFEKLLERAIRFSGGKPKHVIVVSIPDYGITPFVSDKFKQAEPGETKFLASRISAELDAYNLAAKEITIRHGAHWVDITEISRSRGLEPQMLAEDKLHPSGGMYKLWADEVFPVAKKILETSQQN